MLVNTNELKKYITRNRLSIFIRLMHRLKVTALNKQAEIHYKDGRIATIWIKHYNINDAIKAIECDKILFPHQKRSNDRFLEALTNVKN